MSASLADRVVGVFAIDMTTRFRGITRREGVLLSGPAGVAEFSPFWDYGAEESASWLRAAVDHADHGFPSPLRLTIPVNCTVPAVGPEAAAAVVAASGGCRTAKVKVADAGQSLDDDVARVAAVRAALGADGRVRVDANGAWTVAQAVEAIAALSEFDLEYVEQPTASLDDLRRVRAAVDVPIAADESIRRADDPLRVRDLGAADIAVLKVQPIGGVTACLRMAEQLAMPVVVSSALETSVGIAAGLALAAALPDLPHACGLATTSLLTADVVAAPLRPVDGGLPVGRPALDPDALDAVRADDDTTRRWLERMAQCQRVLEDQAR